MNPDIIEKIKKLLRMKRGGTQAEVETALRLAQELANKHGINLDSVNPDEARPEPLTHTNVFCGHRFPYECHLSGLVAQEFFHVTVLISRGWRRVGIPTRYVFIGTDSNIAIAKYVYHFLVFSFRDAWRTRSGRCRNRKAFLWGMYLGIVDRLFEAKPKLEDGSTGLILLSRALALRAEYLKNNFGETEKAKSAPNDDDKKARWLGFLAGRDTHIKPAVAAPLKPAGLLT